MDFLGAQELALRLMGLHGLAGWAFGWNRRKRSLGLCRYREQRIELSAYFVQANDEVQVRETILHEIAHGLAGEKAGHGPLWKAKCARVGCMPIRCDQGQAQMPAGRWQAVCGACGKHYNRHRRPARRARYWCRVCGPERGAVVFAAEVRAAG
ncbi:MAG TPA: SprT-like domain-containing protein [Phycisphaerae bacterium]|jgi:predicted SprT family Zn-dependent metalloprotease